MSQSKSRANRSLTNRSLTTLRTTTLGLSLALLIYGCSSNSSGVISNPPTPTPAAARKLLVGNTRGNNVLRFDPVAGTLIDEFIPAGTGGLFSPDTILLGPDANGDGQQDLYIASGNRPATSPTQGASAVLRFDGITGSFIDVFVGDDPTTPSVDETGGLIRPYGLAFSPDGILYVSSFLSDQILRYDGKTGRFIDVFAQGNRRSGGLNGPNGLLFGPNGDLYVTTQGSVAINGEANFTFDLPSELLQFNPATGASTIFAAPAPAPESPGFVSLLGLALGPDRNLYVSDFANSIRVYNLSGSLVREISTNYTNTTPSSNFMGGLTFGTGNNLFTVGFDSRMGANNIGTILRFDAATGQPLPTSGNSGAVFVPPNPSLNRPIGILFY